MTEQEVDRLTSCSSVDHHCLNKPDRRRGGKEGARGERGREEELGERKGREGGEEK